MTKLTILRGISGSGKSTWARQQNATVVSRDAIRDMLFPDRHLGDSRAYYAQDKAVLSRCEQTVSVVQDQMIAGLLKAGKDVIVDNTNIEFKYVRALAKIGYRYGAEVEVKVFDVDLHTAQNNDRYRAASGGRSVGHEVISKQHERFKKNKSMTLDPVAPVRPYSGTPGKPKAFLFDLDGTVYHMNGKRGPYDHNVDVDDPDPVVIGIVDALWSSGLVAIAMSGRKEATRETTENCLYRDGAPYTHLFMRKDGDDRADNIIKAELFDEFVRDNFDVQFVLDDRDQVVEMWRRMGLKCLQVEPGDF